MKKKIIIIACVIIVAVVSVFFAITLKKEKTILNCTKDNVYVEGITNSENLKINLKNKKINSIDLTKTIKLSSAYLSDGTSYLDATYNTLKDSYSYLDDAKYQIFKHDDGVVAKINLNNSGLILENISIKNTDTNSFYDLEFIPYNDLENSDSAISIGENYNIKDLKKRIENYGYSCKLK